MKSFADYKKDAPNWITMANGEFYPDILESACELYKPVLVLFEQLIKTSESSERLLREIMDVHQQWMRIQLCRVFRKYVSPQTPVEMLKNKSKLTMICANYGKYFRTIDRVQSAFSSRPMPDEAYSDTISISSCDKTVSILTKNLPLAVEVLTSSLSHTK